MMKRNNMFKYIFYQTILISILVSSCSLQKSITKTDYFEGIITYEIEYELKDDRFLESQLKENIGAKMILTFKNGDYLKQYYSENGKLLSEVYLNLNESKSYNKQIENDTIYWVNINKNDSRTTFIRLKDSIVCNEPTIALKTMTTVTGPGFNNQSIEVTGELHFSKNLKVDPNWYTNYLEGNFNEQIKVGKGIQLLFISNGPYWTKRMTATLIEQKKIDNRDMLFDIINNSILKEL